MAKDSRTLKNWGHDVDGYLEAGCGRCSLGGTPQCKVHRWHEELVALRALLLEVGLEEQIKWGMPCYLFQGKNVVMLAAFKDYCCLSFFKGALLEDPAGILVFAGQDSQVGKQARFRSMEELKAVADVLPRYIAEAIQVELSGKKVERKSIEERPIPEELVRRFTEYPALEEAFKALTPGRQRSYLQHFGSAKQATTRKARIAKCESAIFAGKGFGER
ncbi:MAG: YdeI/OmpD-associated family protein [Bacteroidetes bacterium]|nr:YdeI/OmpD-associated family protein [Bacteroidota bacterium]